MDMPWGSPESGKFVTNVGLITTKGPHGSNIASMEWTHHVSYSPGLVMVNPRSNRATAENILATKQFGVNLVADNQNVVASVSGNSTGKEVDKISVLKELGVGFTNAKNIDVLMVEGASLQIECKLVESKEVGDHMMFIGEVVNVAVGSKEPAIYHGGKYYKLGEQIRKPNQETLGKIEQLVKKHAKK